MTESYKPTPNTIAVDLDATLATYKGWNGITEIGEPIPGAREFLKALGNLGHVLIYTTRTNIHNAVEADVDREYLVSMVENWLLKHHMHFDEVYAGDGKPYASAFVDDRAVPCRPQDAEEPIAEYMATLTNVYSVMKK